METSLFWDAKKVDGTYDRTYSSDDFALMFEGFWGSGVVPNRDNALFVEPIENSMSVYVCAGDAFVGGRFYQNSEDLKLTLDVSSDTDRTDLIVLRMDKSKRSIYLRVLKGADGGEEPTFAKLDSCYDLVLARVRIPANSQYLLDEYVEDLRGTVDCPWVSLRWSASNLQESFQAWFERIQKAFGESPAGALQEQIDSLSKELEASDKALEEANEKIKALESARTMIRKKNDIFLLVKDYDATLDGDLS